jgi:hypothetical protein
MCVASSVNRPFSGPDTVGLAAYLSVILISIVIFVYLRRCLLTTCSGHRRPTDFSDFRGVSVEERIRLQSQR